MFKIIKKKLLSPNIYLLEIYAPDIANSAKPGQFVIIIANEFAERIPLTIADFDTKTGSVSVVIQEVGEGSKEICSYNENEYLSDFVGPLGQPSELYYLRKDELLEKNILFIAGGLGTAPVYPQVKWLKEQGISSDVIIGARNQEAVIYENEMKKVAKNVYITTDDGSYIRKGLVTDELKRLISEENKKYNLIVTIGPMIMMKFVSMLTKELQIPTIASLNPIMVDGTGMCGACRVIVDGKVKFACVDGPEFDAHLVDFDMALKRQVMLKEEKITPKSGDKIDNIEFEFNKKKKTPDFVQSPCQRIYNFDEVSLGYDETRAKLEASRCLNCKKPHCVEQCPVGVKIPEFLMQVKEGNFEAAAKIILEDNALPAICGRVCPQEDQCEGSCIIGKKSEAVGIGRLERFVADWVRERGIKFSTDIIKNGKKVAVIGSGPSGLACALDLAKKGYEVVIYEALQKPGGVLVYGIPDFRLPKDEVVQSEIQAVLDLGVKIQTNIVIGRTKSIDDLLEKDKFDAIFIGSGAGLPKFMKIKGEEANGVFSANEFLTRSILMKGGENGYKTPIGIGKNVAIIGAGNVAMDAARTAKRLGSKVYVIYRRSEEEAPARLEEIHHAKEEGIIFNFLTNPKEILKDEKGNVKAIKCVKMELSDEDESGRRAPVEIKNSEFIMNIDSVIISIGTSPNPLIRQTTKGLSVNEYQCIVADENGKTTKEKVYAGGDAVTGAATVILAMGAGKKAAAAIDEMLV